MPNPSSAAQPLPPLTATPTTHQTSRRHVCVWSANACTSQPTERCLVAVFTCNLSSCLHVFNGKLACSVVSQCMCLRSFLGSKGLDWPAGWVGGGGGGVVVSANSGQRHCSHTPSPAPLQRTGVAITQHVTRRRSVGQPCPLHPPTVVAVLREHQQRLVPGRKLPHEAWFVGRQAGGAAAGYLVLHSRHGSEPPAGAGGRRAASQAVCPSCPSPVLLR